MKFNIKITPKSIIRSILGGAAVGLLSGVLAYLTITGFQLSIDYLKPIIITLLIILWIIFNTKPVILYIMVSLLISGIGLFLIFVSGNQEVINQITWDPGLLSAGVSIVAVALAFFTSFFPPKSKDENKTQKALLQNQYQQEPLKSIKYAFTLVAILGIVTLIKDYLEKKRKEKD